MVLTRSADKRLSQNNRKDNLALRSKPEDGQSSAALSDSEPSVQGSIKRKSKISVNIPPRKRARKSYDGADDVDEGKAGLVDAPNDSVSGETNNARSEIPDSQESPLKPSTGGNIRGQSDSTPNSSSTSTKKRQTGTNVRQAAPFTPSNVVTPTSKGDHKRFGSEDPVERQIEDVANDEHASQAIEPPASDEDDAPEVATTKAVVPGNASQNKRTKRAKKSGPKEQVEAVLLKAKPKDSPSEAQAVLDGDEIDDSAALPILRVDTVNTDPVSTTLDSEDSGDSAFVTARTTRHIDVFATPTGGTPQIRSPALPQPGNVGVIGSTINKQPKQLQEPFVRSGSSASSSPALPRKASNSLENHRKQTLLNRANASGGGRRRVIFHLQEDWPGKKRNFVVGY